MLCFRFWVLVWLPFLFLLLVVRFIHHCFQIVVFVSALTNFQYKKFAGTMFKPTSSSISLTEIILVSNKVNINKRRIQKKNNVWLWPEIFQ